MSNAIAPTNYQEIDKTTENEDITRAELDAIIDDTLTPQEATLYRLINSNEAGRTHLSAFVQRAFGTHPTNAECSAMTKAIIGKMNDRGVSRACAFRILTGFTPEKVQSLLANLMDSSEDERVLAKVADTSARVLGMIKGTNVNIHNQLGIQINARTLQMVDEDTSD
jgi:PII-like signaling protein